MIVVIVKIACAIKILGIEVVLLITDFTSTMEYHINDSLMQLTVTCNCLSRNQALGPHTNLPVWQVLEPALRLAFNLMTSLGLENQQAAQGVLSFLDAHSDPLLGSLYFAPGKLMEGPAELPLLRLRELGLVASVLHLSACCAGEDEAEESWPRAPFGHRESLAARIRRVVLALLPPFAAGLREHEAGNSNVLGKAHVQKERCF